MLSELDTSRLDSEQLRLAFEKAPIGIAIVDLEGRFLQVNDALCRITGYSCDELRGTSFRAITHPDDLDKDLHEAARLLAGEISYYQMEKRYLRPDGSYVWVNFSGSMARSGAGAPRYFIAHIEDITERVAVREQLEHNALHDPLTDLANRQYLMRRLHQALEFAERRDHEVALLFCDIDHFKDINDLFGHDTGDLALIGVANRLHAVVRASDTPARMGGDEFVVLCEDVNRRDEVFGVVARIREAMKQPLQCGAHRLHISMSIGVAFAGSGDDDLARLLREADRDMYRDKSRRTARAAPA